MQGQSPFRLSVWEWSVLLFTLSYLGVAWWVTTRRGNYEFVFYFFVMCLLLAAIFWIRGRLELPMAALWGLSLWGLAHMAGGLLILPPHWPVGGESHVLYNWWLIPGRLKYDQVVHALGFGLVTWLCWLGLRQAFLQQGLRIQPTLGLLTLCIAAGMGFGAANEVVEFIASQMIAGTNVGGYVNTGWDLVANSVGALLAALGIYSLDPGKGT
jgi:hypothetical protein